MPAVETRNLARDSLFLLAELRGVGQSAGTKVRVRNLSPGGMMAEGELAVRGGDKVSVEFRTIGNVEGSVAWVQGNRCGIAFVSEIDPKQARAPVNDAAPAPMAPSGAYRTTPVDPSKLRKI